jgi:hypothetical protein
MPRRRFASYPVGEVGEGVIEGDDGRGCLLKFVYCIAVWDEMLTPYHCLGVWKKQQQSLRQSGWAKQRNIRSVGGGVSYSTDSLQVGRAGSW